MPEIKGVMRSSKPIEIQATSGDESTNLLELKNEAGATVYSITNVGTPSVGGVSAHGSLTGLLNNDHTQYVLKDVTDVYTVSGHTLDRAVTASGYTITNGTTDRTYDANSYTTDELADVLATLIADFTEARNLLFTLIDDLQDRELIG